MSDTRTRYTIELPQDSIPFLLRGGQSVICKKNCVIEIKMEGPPCEDFNEAVRVVEDFWDD